MSAALQRFEQALARISKHLEGRALRHKLIALESDALSTSGRVLTQYQEFFRSNRTNEAIVEYSAAVVLLYGALERYIEDAVTDYVQRLCEIVREFEALPEKIKEAHTSLSADLLKAKTTRKYEARVNEEEVLEILLKCVRGTNPCQLNAMAFSQHNVNFRIASISEMFSRVDVKELTSRVKRRPEFATLAEMRTGLANLENYKDAIVFQDIDHLVEWRNDVAHGEASQMRSSSEISEIVRYLREFGRAVQAVITETLLQKEIDHRGIPLPAPIKVIDRRIVCFENTPRAITIGDRLAAVDGDMQPHAGVVKELQVEGVTRDTIEPAAAKSFGVEVTFRAKENWRYYLL